MKYETSIGRFSFKIAALNILEKFLENISGRAQIRHGHKLSICALL